MSGQEQRKRQDPSPEGSEPTPEPVPAAATAKKDADLDSLLDEIDGVLETNAQEFVHGFVQKGGQ